MPHWAKEPKDRKKLDKADYVLGSKNKLAPPSLCEVGIYFDNNAALLSRVYDRDRDRVIQRGKADGVCGVMCWNPDIDKLEELRKLCSVNESFCYFMAGVHPDNISRTNKSQQDAWHLKIDEFSRERYCRAIYSGLNITRRDVHSHFAQESMLRCLYQHAKALSLPLFLLVESREAETKPGYEVGEGVNANLTRVTKVLREEGWGTSGEDIQVIIQDAISTCRGDVNIMQTIVDNGYYVSVSLSDLFFQKSSAVDDVPYESALDVDLKACCELVPRHRVLLSSNSPYQTPQNIPDEAIRLSKNEPSNFKFIVEFLAPYFGISEEELAKLNLENSKRVYNIDASPSAPEKHHNVESGDFRANSLDKSGDMSDKISKLALSSDTACPDLAQCYACLRCAAILFSSDHLLGRHPVMTSSCGETVLTAATVASSTDTGTADSVPVELCNAVYFLPSSLLGTNDGAYKDSLLADDKLNISCSSCNAKIGKKQVDGTSTCPCGFVLDCPTGVLRLSAAKVQLHSAVVSKSKAKQEIVNDSAADAVLHSNHRPRSNTKDKDSLVTSEPEKGAQKQQGKTKKTKSTRKNH